MVYGLWRRRRAVVNDIESIEYGFISEKRK